MNKVLKCALLLVLSLSLSPFGFAQLIKDPTTWSYEVKKKTGGQYDLVFHLKLAEGWHIWSQKPGGDGFQIPPTFAFDKNSNVQLVGAAKESGKGKHTGMMDGVDGEVTYYEGAIDYVQTVKVTGKATIAGKHEYQVCNDQMCLPPKKKSFKFEVTDDAKAAETGAPATIDPPGTTSDTVAAIQPVAPSIAGDDSMAVTPAFASETGEEVAEAPKTGLMGLFGQGLAAGLFAVITPCVFAMLPMNVSFFLKRSKTRRKGIWTAVQYSLSILIIFAIVGLLVSLLPGNAFNNLSTNWILNLVFFAIFLLFGISFLGAFEINLPSSWATKIDSKANTSSFLGIFFMALTLVIVSFSCTVPFIGGLLFLAKEAGTKLGPIIGFLGFGAGLALPFTLFAIFPTLLSEFGKAGGWLNAVKVVFGLVELALALKFLSNADLAQGWRLLDREVYLACWTAISFVLGLYLLGVVRFSHDSELPKNDWGLPYLKVPRLFFALAALIFGFYLIPGMWGAPLNGISALLPPPGTQDFVLNSNMGGNTGFVSSGASNSENSAVKPVKYVSDLRIYEPLFVTQNGIESYFDYNEALAASKILKKPIMLDFTGINCANCRKMESQVLSNPQVASLLKEKFIIASLYCDYDKMPLPKKDQFYSEALQSDVETLGDYNEHIQASKFQSNAQPFYFFVDENGNKLVPEGYQYNSDVSKFIAHLNRVLENYGKESQSTAMVR